MDEDLAGVGANDRTVLTLGGQGEITITGMGATFFAADVQRQLQNRCGAVTVVVTPQNETGYHVFAVDPRRARHQRFAFPVDDRTATEVTTDLCRQVVDWLQTTL